MNINQKDTYIWMYVWVYVWMNEREYVSILSTQWDTNQLNANFSYDLQNKKNMLQNYNNQSNDPFRGQVNADPFTQN